MKAKFILFVLTLSCFNLFAQNEEAQIPKPTIDWVFFLDGYNTTDFADLEVDEEGNTYFAANYSMGMSIPGFDQKFPYSKHMLGTLIKLNPKGEVIWAVYFESSYDNRVKDLIIAPNGDILLTGHTDGITKFPGLKDTLAFGKPKPKNRFHRFQYSWLARYSPDGDRVWAKVLGAPWGEGVSIAIDKDENIYWSMYHKGSLRDGEKLIDSLPAKQNHLSRVSIFKLNSKGEILSKFPLRYHTESSNTWTAPRLRMDRENNLVVFGLYAGTVQFSETDSLQNDPYYGKDAYLLKYNAEGELQWFTSVSGQSSEIIEDVTFDHKNRIYAVGSFRYECIISNGINLVQKSKFEYKSGSSFFTARFLPNGTLDYAKFNTPDGYNTNCSAWAIALDAAGYAHISGSFSDTIRFPNGPNTIGTSRHNQATLSSIWKRDSIISLSKDIDNIGWNYAPVVRINKNKLVKGGYYYGEQTITLSSGKKVKFSQYEHGRATFIFGGRVPVLKEFEDEVVEDSLTDAIASMELPECYSPLVEQEADVWFPYKPTLEEEKSAIDSDADSKHQGDTDCGVKIKSKEAKLFPNPTQSITNLEMVGLQGMVRIEIRSEKGDLVFAQQLEVTQEKRTVQFDVSSAADGLYYVSVVQKGYQKVFRLIKHR